MVWFDWLMKQGIREHIQKNIKPYPLWRTKMTYDIIDIRIKTSKLFSLHDIIR